MDPSKPYTPILQRLIYDGSKACFGEHSACSFSSSLFKPSFQCNPISFVIATQEALSTRTNVCSGHQGMSLVGNSLHSLSIYDSGWSNDYMGNSLPQFLNQHLSWGHLSHFGAVSSTNIWLWTREHHF